MSNKKSPILAVIGLILIIATFLVFFLTTNVYSYLLWSAFSFALLGEILFVIYGLIIGKVSKSSNGVLLRSGGYSLIFIYLVLTLILSIIFPVYFYHNTGLFISLMVIVNALTLIIFILLVAFAKRSAAVDQASKGKMQSLEALVLKSKNILATSDSKNKYEINKVYEALRYSDYYEETEFDNEILSKLDELESELPNNNEESSANITSLCDSIITLVDKRKLLIVNNKRGSF